MLGVIYPLIFFPWFLFLELGLMPMFFLIKIWGAEDRTYASFKFFIYTLAGSIGMLLAFSFLYLATGTFDLLQLREMAGTGELTTKIATFVTDINARTGLHLTPHGFAVALFWGT